MTIIPRTAIGLSPVVKNINRITRRPLLRRQIGAIICHYTGAKRKYAGLTQIQVYAAIRSIDRWRANEYNYVIDQLGRVYEFAGEHQAAHARGYNDTAYGVLFLNGIGEPLTDAQVEAFRFLTGALMWTQAVVPHVWVLGHGQVASTACPGPVWDRMADLRAAAASHTAVAA